MKIINKTKLIIDALRKDGKVKTIPPKTFEKMNEEMKKVREEYRMKEIRSWQQAENIYLD